MIKMLEHSPCNEKHNKTLISELFIISVACVDKLNNCADYVRSGTCTKSQFAAWARDNCARTCFCCKYLYDLLHTCPSILFIFDNSKIKKNSCKFTCR